MFERVTIRVADPDASRSFYELLLGREWREFAIEPADDDHSVTRRLHVGFVAQSRAEVDAFWRRGVDSGYPSDGEPGPRPEYAPDYYGAFLLDPDGNSAEAVHHGAPRSPEKIIDHLWIRVADLDATKRFWREAAPLLGLRIVNERPERFHVAGERSFALVRGKPTRNVHLAFPVPVPVSVSVSGEPASFVDPDGNTIEAVGRAAR